MSTPYISDGFTCVTPGQPRPLSTIPLPVAWVRIRADKDNTGIVCIGGPQVNAISNPVRGDYIAANVVWKDTDCDLSQIFLDASVANESVSFTYGNT